MRVFLLDASNKIKAKFIHHLVLEAFISPCPQGYQTNHKDGNKANNSIDNLEWITPSCNRQHAFKIGLQSLKGELHNRAKLSNADVDDIKQFALTMSMPHLAKIYDVNYSTIYRIVKGQRRKS